MVPEVRVTGKVEQSGTCLPDSSDKASHLLWGQRWEAVWPLPEPALSGYLIGISLPSTLLFYGGSWKSRIE